MKVKNTDDTRNKTLIKFDSKRIEIRNKKSQTKVEFSRLWRSFEAGKIAKNIMKLGTTVPNFKADSTKGLIDFYEWQGDS